MPSSPGKASGGPIRNIKVKKQSSRFPPSRDAGGPFHDSLDQRRSASRGGSPDGDAPGDDLASAPFIVCDLRTLFVQCLVLFLAGAPLLFRSAQLDIVDAYRRRGRFRDRSAINWAAGSFSDSTKTAPPSSSAGDGSSSAAPKTGPPSDATPTRPVDETDVLLTKPPSSVTVPEDGTTAPPPDGRSSAPLPADSAQDSIMRTSFKGSPYDVVSDVDNWDVAVDNFISLKKPHPSADGSALAKARASVAAATGASSAGTKAEVVGGPKERRRGLQQESREPPGPPSPAPSGAGVSDNSERWSEDTINKKVYMNHFNLQQVTSRQIYARQKKVEVRNVCQNKTEPCIASCVLGHAGDYHDFGSLKTLRYKFAARATVAGNHATFAVFVTSGLDKKKLDTPGSAGGDPGHSRMERRAVRDPAVLKNFMRTLNVDRAVGVEEEYADVDVNASVQIVCRAKEWGVAVGGTGFPPMTETQKKTGLVSFASARAQHGRFATCMAMVEQWERDFGMRFDWVVKHRPDNYAPRPGPRFRDLVFPPLPLWEKALPRAFGYPIRFSKLPTRSARAMEESESEFSYQNAEPLVKNPFLPLSEQEDPDLFPRPFHSSTGIDEDPPTGTRRTLADHVKEQSPPAPKPTLPPEPPPTDGKAPQDREPPPPLMAHPWAQMYGGIDWYFAAARTFVAPLLARLPTDFRCHHFTDAQVISPSPEGCAGAPGSECVLTQWMSYHGVSMVRFPWSLEVPGKFCGAPCPTRWDAADPVAMLCGRFAKEEPERCESGPCNQVLSEDKWEGDLGPLVPHKTSRAFSSVVLGADVARVFSEVVDPFADVELGEPTRMVCDGPSFNVAKMGWYPAKPTAERYKNAITEKFKGRLGLLRFGVVGECGGVFGVYFLENFFAISGRWIRIRWMYEEVWTSQKTR